MPDFIILPGGTASPVIESMHRLRYQIFIKELGWTYNMNSDGQKEWDDYDNDNATYIVRLKENDIAGSEVIASCRLIPTSKPYMLKDHYPHFCRRNHSAEH